MATASEHAVVALLLAAGSLVIALFTYRRTSVRDENQSMKDMRDRVDRLEAENERCATRCTELTRRLNDSLDENTRLMRELVRRDLAT